eukprot:gene96-4345_t
MDLALQFLEDEDEPTSIDFGRIKTKLLEYFENIKSIPKFFVELFKILTSPSKFIKFWRDLFQKIQKLPIFIFYKYLWEKKKSHLFYNLFVNYIFPIILESLPWYFSQNKLGKELRTIKNSLQHNMLQGIGLTVEIVLNYCLYTSIYCFLQTLDRHLKNRVASLNKYSVKRLVLERLLYSEIWSLDFYEKNDIERRISIDIQSTLNLFSFTVPNLVSNFYTILREGSELYERREQIDMLAIARPMISIFGWKITDWFKVTVFGRKMALPFLDNENVKYVINSTLDGMTDIQLNNSQLRQMEKYDQVYAHEFAAEEDVRFFFNRFYSHFTNRGVFDFLFDILITTHVMKKRGITHEQYKKLQLDIDHLFNLARRTGNLAQRTQRVLGNQSRIMNLMNLPNFQHEEDELQEILTFNEILVKDVKFTYPKVEEVELEHEDKKSKKQKTKNEEEIIEQEHEQDRLALDIEGEIKFESGKTYAIIGQNRSGKSTLVHLLCKLYSPQSGNIYFDNFDSSLLCRNSLRNLISYVAQKPYIFAGTIRENILLGDPKAEEEEIIEAATRAGIFTFDEIALLKQKEDEKKDEKTLKKNIDLSQSLPNINQLLLLEEESKNKVELTREKKIEILNTKTLPRGTNLSGGFQQSVALARVFLKRHAKLFILDESTSAMDPIKKRQIIMPELLKFTKENKITLIIISHDILIGIG